MNTHCIGIIFIPAEGQQEFNCIPVANLPILGIPKIVVSQIGMFIIVHRITVYCYLICSAVNFHIHSAALYHSQPDCHIFSGLDTQSQSCTQIRQAGKNPVPKNA